MYCVYYTSSSYYLGIVAAIYESIKRHFLPRFAPVFKAALLHLRLNGSQTKGECTYDRRT